MLKLIRYEFRKARVVFLALIGVAALLQLSFQVSLRTGDDEMLLVSIALLALCAFAVAIFVLVRGVTSYSSELRSTSGYLTFLTPNSTLKIVGSKFLYTFINALIAFVVFAVVFVVDFAQFMNFLGEYENMLKLVNDTLDSFGVHLSEFFAYGVFMVGYLFLNLLSVVAVAYFSYTVSITLLRDKKWNWLPAVVLFLLINWGVHELNGLFEGPLSQLNLVDVNFSVSFGRAAASAAPSADSIRAVILPALLPPALISLGLIVFSLFSCAWMLEKKVNL